jgi:PAS domain S-box-containing protein
LDRRSKILLVAHDPAGQAPAVPGARRVEPTGLAALEGEPPSVVVVGPGVERPTSVGRQARRRWPSSKTVFLLEPDALPRFQAGLPFTPELAGAVALPTDVPHTELEDVLERLAEAAERERNIKGIYSRLNTELQSLGASKATLHRREEQLVLAERYLATVLDHAPQALISADLSGVIVTCNPAAAVLLGTSTGGCAGLRLADMFAPESGESIRTALKRSARGTPTRLEAHLARDPDLVVEFSVAPVIDAAGRPAAHSVALLDLTQRKRVEAELAETNRRLNAVLDNATVAIFLMDDRQQCAYMNEAAERLTGYSWEETQGRPLHDVIHHTRPDGSFYPIEECPIDRAFPENRQEQGEDVFVHKDGRFYNVAFTASPIRDGESRTIGTIIEVRDITEDKRNEQARDLLMREVDHRARNVLAVAQSMVQLTKAPTVELFREVLLGRVSALARAQASLSKSAWQGAQLKDVVCDELETFGRPGSYDVSGPDVLLRPEQVQPIGMIVHELATNAAKYGAFSTPTGRIEVEWSLGPRGRLRLKWSEDGGPVVAPPGRHGFGSRLIAGLAQQLGGHVRMDWRPSGLMMELTTDDPENERALQSEADGPFPAREA